MVVTRAKLGIAEHRIDWKTCVEQGILEVFTSGTRIDDSERVGYMYSPSPVAQHVLGRLL